MIRGYIDDQIAVIATLTPGCDEHRVATNLLLMLQDGLELLLQTRDMVRRANAIRSRSR